MKKAFLFLMLAIALCGCVASESGPYTATKNGIRFTVDAEKSTISDGINTYRYVFSGNASEYDMEIRYPDGSAWYWHTQSNGEVAFGGGGWSDDYDAERYVPGEVLREVLKEKAQKQAPAKNMLPELFLLGVGAIDLAFPRAVWYLGGGWRYKDSEPSDLALCCNRAGGAFAIVIAVLMILL